MKKEKILLKTGWIIRGAVISLLLFIVFIYGAGVGHYHWPPFSILQNVKSFYNSDKNYYGEQELLQFAFTDPLIPGEKIYKPITSLDGIEKLNKSILFPYDNFFNAYNNITIAETSYLELNDGRDRILKLTYKIEKMEYVAFAYSPMNEKRLQEAALIIPGSGENQSSEIYRELSSNYHFGIMEALGKQTDKYILIKPNEDCLAFHNGNNKLNNNFIINWQLDQGASYSAHYIANSLAIIKYLKEKYSKVIVAGLSQGGDAAFLNSLQSQPDIAIIASGFSVINKKAKWSGFDQIIIPGLRQHLGFGTVKSIIDSSTTNFLFTYGMQEEGTYKIEAEDRFTCKYFADLKNVACEIHNKGHAFYIEEIKEKLIKWRDIHKTEIERHKHDAGIIDE